MTTTMAPLYNFGLSQEDPLTEMRGMDLSDGDSLLCIAGAGEMPLNMAALRNVSVVAVDRSPDQLRLCRIKQLAALCLEPPDAAGFLGYTRIPDVRRDMMFKHMIRAGLNPADLDFWESNGQAVSQGVIHAGKFEKFIGKASLPARMLIGKKNFYRLFDCHSTVEQEAVFDRYFARILLKTVFKTVFHPRIYTNRGIDSTGMQHKTGGNIGDLFFNRFRSFCCSTLARDNFLLQYVFFRRSLFPGALPEYLKPENHERFLQNNHRISFVLSDMENFITQARPGQFNKIQLSNIGDWMSKESMAELFRQIQVKTGPGSRVVLRYIYLDHPLPASAPFLKADHAFGEELLKTDRFPFSFVVPITVII